MPLNTRLRLIPLLLCWMSGTAIAAGLPPLLVSPDLVPEAKRAARPAPPAPAARTPKPGVAPSASPAATPAPSPVSPTAGSPAKARVSVTQPAPETRPRPERAALALPAGSTSVKALRIVGARTIELVAEGEAELQRDDTILTADRVTYREPTDEALAEGNVELRQGDDTIVGPKATLVIGQSTGSFESPVYQLSRQRQPNLSGEESRIVAGSGKADELRLEGENQYRLKNATWTTCEASNPD